MSNSKTLTCPLQDQYEEVAVRQSFEIFLSMCTPVERLELTQQLLKIESYLYLIYTRVFFFIPLNLAVGHYSWKWNFKERTPGFILCFLKLINPLHHKISIHIVHTGLYTFPAVLTKGICVIIKRIFIWRSFPCLSWPQYVIRGWHFNEKPDNNYS